MFAGRWYFRPVLIVPHPEGRVAVPSHSHGWMCGQIARAWGSEAFGELQPREEVCLAAEQHDLGMAAYDLEPDLDPESGLPRDVMNMDLSYHLERKFEGPLLLSQQSRHAALLASLHHNSWYERPSPARKVRKWARVVDDYVRRSERFQRDLWRDLNASEDEVERGWRLVRSFDALSHMLLMDRAPSTREDVPAAGGRSLDVTLDRNSKGRLTLDPWPFRADSAVFRTEGRLLTGTWTDRERMLADLAEARWVTLVYEVAPA